jgi:hypothetical protein
MHHQGFVVHLLQRFAILQMCAFLSAAEKESERETWRVGIFLRGVTAKMGLDGTVHQSNLG